MTGSASKETTRHEEIKRRAQEQTAEGTESRFSRLVNREQAR